MNTNDYLNGTNVGFSDLVDIEAVFSNFLQEYDKDPDNACSLIARILLAPDQLQMRIEFCALCDPKPLR